ncbi:imidazolonepropionase [Candidatus Heimdallarchaeota archaeon B3_Heim]|nr:MAG: imidazolonepropionase [Candidatus Heimdallarchaeota archaeon B3_Heim]
MVIQADFVIINANELVTLAGSSETPRTKEKMKDLGIVNNGAVAVKDGKIVAVGKTNEVLRQLDTGYEVIDATNKLVTPGLIDPHVHLVFAGTREDELEKMAVLGISYLEIKEQGGGMNKSLKLTSETSFEDQIRITSKILDKMLIHGTTTIEAKSGYEMTFHGEIKQLEIIKSLNESHPLDLVPTFLAQGIPPEYEDNSDLLVSEIAEKWIPEIAKRNLAEYADVFCEKGYYNLEQTRRILLSARKHGLKLRNHCDWLAHSGGTRLSAEIGDIVSVDHLIWTPLEEVDALQGQKTIIVFLPTSPFCYVNKYAPAREIIDRGMPVALATDVSAANMCESMQMMMTLAVLRMEMTAAEALTASTINAAHSINRAHEIGSLEVGKKADIVLFDAPNHRFFAYNYGINLVEKVLKDGNLVVVRGRRTDSDIS